MGKKEKYIDDIVSRMSKSEWTLSQAKDWHERLIERGYKVHSFDKFYNDVLNRFDSFHTEMDAYFKQGVNH
ncbi:hypothetical protein [Escherichia coli]|uniref:hypothetical protein n=1 Tax=Escherichia coli TaxID=562 RepID=UPI0002A334C3|nr:hypothetical protein [Escherichia coli]ELC54763.1 hypothetical protein WGI_05095 [Escherichia coli KTE44]